MVTYELKLTLQAEDIDGYQELLNFARSSQWKRWNLIKYIDHAIYSPKAE